MIVTGDRDAFQLIDEDGLVEVMATSRGITETKIYDRQAVVDRYGIAPELIPDFYGLKGDTSDNIPGVPGIGDKTASELLQRFGIAGGGAGRTSTTSAAPSASRTSLEHAEDARISKRLATIQRDDRVDFDPVPRWRASPTARACARCSASTSCAIRCGAWRRRWAAPRRPRPPPAAEKRSTARVREGTRRRRRRRCAGDELSLAVRAAEVPRRAVRARARLALRRGRRPARRRGAGRRLRRPERGVAACGERPVVAHDAKALASVPPDLVHDTLLGAYLLEPARRGYPFAELCEERGLATDLEDPAAARRGADRRAGRLAARADRRARPGAA